MLMRTQTTHCLSLALQQNKNHQNTGKLVTTSRQTSNDFNSFGSAKAAGLTSFTATSMLRHRALKTIPNAPSPSYQLKFEQQQQQQSMKIENHLLATIQIFCCNQIFFIKF
jgi:hypothetical protein